MSRSIALTFNTADVPTSALEDEAALRLFVRLSIARACELGLEPDLAAPSLQPRRSLMTHLTDSQISHLNALLAKQAVRVPVATAAGRLAEAGARLMAQDDGESPAGPDDALAEVLGLLKLQRRTEQKSLYTHIAQALAQGTGADIVLAQASTGSGKTMVAHALTVDWLRGALNAKPDAVVVVSFPTLLGVKTFARQWSAVHAELALPDAQTLRGRGEFVSRFSLEQHLAMPTDGMPGLSQSEVESVAAWLAEQDQDPEGQASAWEMDSLLEVAQNIDKPALCVNSLSSEDDPGSIAYRAQFVHAESSRLIVCTHAMLASDILIRQKSLYDNAAFQDVRKAVLDEYLSSDERAQRAAKKLQGIKNASIPEVIAAAAQAMTVDALAEGVDILKRRIPVYQHLIVDEAHLLDQAFSSCFSSSVSLREVSRKLRALAEIDKGKDLRQAIAVVEAACSALSSMGTDGDTALLDASVESRSPALAPLLSILNAIKSIKVSKRTMLAALPVLAALEADRRSLELALESRSSAVRMMDYSPVRHYPKVQVGRGDVSQPMHSLWSGVQSVVLLSATLYMRQSQGWSARYQVGAQYLPRHRVKEVPVVEAGWLYSPIEALYLPPATPAGTAAGSLPLPWLMPPSRRDKLTPQDQAIALSKWLNDVAAVICWAYRTSPGSALVPCTSHEMVSKLAEATRALLHLQGDRPDPQNGGTVLASTEFPSLGALRREAVERARTGRRSIILATGGAWTGFDLSGHAIGLQGDQDNVLCDLVIPRMPFGVNRSITHLQRMRDKRDPVNHEVIGVTLLMQQALGRLVRGPGLKRNRRIFILDGRLTDAGLKDWLTPCLRLLALYPVVELAVETHERDQIAAIPGT